MSLTIYDFEVIDLYAPFPSHSEYHHHVVVSKWPFDPRYQWALFLEYAPIRVQLLYRTDSAVLVMHHDMPVYVVLVAARDPRHPRSAGFISADPDFALLVVEV